MPGNPAYVDLGDKYPKGYLWSNNPAHMDLYCYFDPSNSDLAREFGIDGLKPILVHTRTEEYLLTADDGKFYMWSDEDGRLLVF